MKNKNSILLSFLVSFIALLLGVLGYYVNKSHQTEQIILAQEAKFSKSSIRQDSLSIALGHELDKLNLLKQKYEDLNEKNTNLVSLIAQLTNQKQMWENRSNLNQNQIEQLQAQLKKTISEYNLLRLKMLKEIDSLKLSGNRLEQNNRNLNLTNDSLKTAHYEQVLVNKTILKKASRLKAENLAVVVIGKNNNIITKTPYKENLINTISVRFNLSKNELAQKGKRVLVMRIQKPDGGILYDETTSNNVFVTQDKQQFYYTVAGDFNFNNNYEEVNLNYKKIDFLFSGTYKVILYIDGEELTSTSFEIR